MFSEMLEISNTEGTSFATASNVYKIYERDHDADIFEGVIDGLILEKYADQDLKDYIKDLPSNKKRVAALLSIGDDNVLWSKINEIIGEEKSGYQRLKSVYTLLKEYVKIADVERKKHGEILTPFKELAEPMVKLIEKYDAEFWKNKNHKVLDSSAGYGTFLILAAYKFMVGLKGEIEDEEERFKWIVENCLYYGELQAKSVFSWLVAIDPHNEYKTNIYWGSFLSKEFDEHAKNVWGVEKWNLIIQNPPYQMRKEGFKKTQPLWHLFVQKSLSLLSEGGYMVMVHPGGWRNVDGFFKETQNLLKSKKVLYLKLHTFRQGQEYFDAAINFDYYILKNEKNNGYLTEILNVRGILEKVDISRVEFISDENIIEIQNLVAKDNEEKVNIIWDSTYHTQKSHVVKNKTEEFKYPVIYTVKSPDKNNTPTFWYTNSDKKHFGIPKIVWANGASGVFIDQKGDYGLTQFAYAIIDNVNNFENIKKAMQTEKFIKDIMGFKHSLGDKYNRKVISTFKKDFWKEFI
jgi:hypothetical protein